MRKRHTRCVGVAERRARCCCTENMKPMIILLGILSHIFFIRLFSQNPRSRGKEPDHRTMGGVGRRMDVPASGVWVKSGKGRVTSVYSRTTRCHTGGVDGGKD